MNKLLPISFLLLCLACAKPRETARGFYFWKQRYLPDSTEILTLRSLSIQKLYVKMFDVTTDAATGSPVPVAKLDQRAPFPPNTEIVPTVFLMNNIWHQADPGKLSGQVASLLEQLCKAQPGVANIREVQIDCDWTRSTKDAYFSFLDTLRLQPFLRNKKLSVTIRMHQVKYLVGSGVPPADNGLLMCYNMGNLRKYGDHNSILNMDDIKAYTSRNRIGHYPLPLDIALPLFEWSILFRRQSYAGILRNLEAADLDNARIFRPNGAHLYTVIKDTLIKGYPLRAGEEIRYETCPPELLKKAARYLSTQRQEYDPAIVFYHLDAAVLDRYNLRDLEMIYNLMH